MFCRIPMQLCLTFHNISRLRMGQTPTDSNQRAISYWLPLGRGLVNCLWMQLSPLNVIRNQIWHVMVLYWIVMWLRTTHVNCLSLILVCVNFRFMHILWRLHSESWVNMLSSSWTWYIHGRPNLTYGWHNLPLAFTSHSARLKFNKHLHVVTTNTWLTSQIYVSDEWGLLRNQ